MDKLHGFDTRAIRVTWSKSRCIHFAACVRGMPAVFQPGEHPWIRLEGADAAQVAEVVTRCPTGALHYQPLDGAEPEAPPPANRIEVSRGGPLYVRGRVRIESESGQVLLDDVRVALCRCGGTHNAPFCDGSHFRSGFADPGEVFEGGMKSGGDSEPGLHITPAEGGPLRLSGPMSLESADGRVRLEGGACSLCRCGGSRNKPFCDGTHSTLPPPSPPAR
ncbi:MAG: CDGSH iron-sulfur domain-containing protein [Candidatus Eiseniibacteriota bacterium]